MTYSHLKTVAIADKLRFSSAIVVAEYLFVQIPEQMERLHVYVGALQSAFEQAPEVSSPLV